MMYSTPRLRMMSWRPDCPAGDIQAACRQARDGIDIELTLRHGDTQRALTGSRRERSSAAAAAQPWRARGRTRNWRRAAFAVCPDGVVVAAPLPVGFPTPARRLRTRCRCSNRLLSDGEVDLDAVRQARSLQQVERLLQAVRPVSQPSRGPASARLGDGGAPAADAGANADGLGEHRRKRPARRRLRSAPSSVTKLDVVRIEHRPGATAAQHRSLRRARAALDTDARRDLEVGNAGKLMIGQQAHPSASAAAPLRLMSSTPICVETPRGSARVWPSALEYPLHVTAERPGWPARARGAHARDLQRDVGTGGVANRRARRRA